LSRPLILFVADGKPLTSKPPPRNRLRQPLRQRKQRPSLWRSKKLQPRKPRASRQHESKRSAQKKLRPRRLKRLLQRPKSQMSAHPKQR
jgi:hypothetical protein